MLHPTTRSCFLSLTASLVMTAIVQSQSPLPFAPLETGTPDANGNRVLGFGDVNGDGSQDMVVTGSPYIFINDGHGRFTPGGGSMGIEPGQTGSSLAISDVNMDGRADVVVASSTSMVLWLGTSVGGLVLSPGSIPTVPGATSIAVGDVNGDGAPEIFVGVMTVNPGGLPPFISGLNVVLQNNGTGTFTAVGALGSPSVANLALTFVDADGDGDQDIAAAGNGGGVTIISNLGGTFGAGPGLFPFPGTSRGVVRVARFNNDAYADFVVSPSIGAPVISLGGPAGPVISPNSVGYSNGVGCAVADFNGDGIDELFDASAPVVNIYTIGALGNPTLHSQLARTGGTLFAADMDQDGDRDLWLFDINSGVNTLYFNTGASSFYAQRSAYEPQWYLGGPCVMDVNADGFPDFLAITPIGNTIGLVAGLNDGTGRMTWGPASVSGGPLANKKTSMCAADLDGDGDKDVVLLECASPTSDTTAIYIRTLMNVAGTFVIGATTPFTQGSYCDIAAADVNNDGKDEVIVAETVTGVRVIWTSPSGGILLPGNAISNYPARALAVKDMDLDGDLDIIATGSFSALMINSGNGVMTLDPTFPVGQAGSYVSAGDVNLDGVPDVYIGNNLYVHLGNTWQFVATIASGSPFNAANETRSFDFDGDGDMDTVTGFGRAYVAEAPGVVSIHTLRLPIGLGIRLLPVDLDLDGDLDLVSQHPILSGVSTIGYELGVLFNTSRHLTVDAPTRPGRPTHIGLRGAPNGHYWLFAAASLTDINIAPYGHLRLDLGSLILLADGPFDSAGTADTSIVLPASYSAFIGAEIAVQGFVDTVGGPKLTNARRVVISNP